MKKSTIVAAILLLTGCSAQTAAELAKQVSANLASPGALPTNFSPSAQPSSGNASSALAPVATAVKVSVPIKVAVIRGSGDIIPAANSSFHATPYNGTQIRKDLALKNNAGPEPKIDDQVFKTKCTTIGSSPFCTADVDAYMKASADWNKKAYAGEEDARKKASNGLEMVSVKTDLSGEGVFELVPGTWYFSGSYKNSVSSVYWFDVPVTVKPGMGKVEFSNSNATDIFNK